MDFERDRLTSAGRFDLVYKIVWVSDKVGDGNGYDIQPYSNQGEVLYIEVTTTLGGIGTPFFLTENEICVSKSRNDQHPFYRLSDYAKAPK